MRALRGMCNPLVSCVRTLHSRKWMPLPVAEVEVVPDALCRASRLFREAHTHTHFSIIFPTLAD